MSDTNELKPCPFCGTSTGYAAPPALGKGRWVIQCDDCRAEGPTSSDNSDAGEAEAIAAWNRRVAPPLSAICPNRSEEGTIMSDTNELREKLAALDKAIEKEEREWSPIETAPKDGTLVDLRLGPICYLGCAWDGRWIVVKGDYLLDHAPTRWRLHTRANHPVVAPPPGGSGEIDDMLERALDPLPLSSTSSGLIRAARKKLAALSPAPAVDDAGWPTKAELVELVSRLALEPLGGEVYDRSEKLREYTERAQRMVASAHIRAYLATKEPRT